MDEPTPEDVEQIVRQAQQLDGWKQRALAELRARGEDTDDVRIIVAHPTGSGDYTATEVMRPRWMDEQPPADDA
jgi:hypothetical protein